MITAFVTWASSVKPVSNGSAPDSLFVSSAAPGPSPDAHAVRKPLAVSSISFLSGGPVLTSEDAEAVSVPPDPPPPSTTSYTP